MIKNKKPPDKKTAIFIHGGAIKGAFAAGVVYQLSKIGLKTADVIIGTSSSVPTAAYFTSQQYDFIRSIWLNEVGTKEFIKYANLLMGRPIFDVEYLIKEVFLKKYPLDIKRMIESKGNLLIPIYNYEEDRLELISTHEKNIENEFCRILQAAITIHDQHIAWGSLWQKYVDADLDPFALYRQEIVPFSYDIVVIINHKHLDNTLKKRLGLKIYRLLQSKYFPEEVKNKLRERGNLIDTGIKCFEEFQKIHNPLVIPPPPTLKLRPTSIVNRNNDKLEILFNTGISVVKDIWADPITRNRLCSLIARSEQILGQ